MVAGLLGAEKESSLSLFSSFSEGDLGLSVIELSVPVYNGKQQHYNSSHKRTKTENTLQSIVTMKSNKLRVCERILEPAQ